MKVHICMSYTCNSSIYCHFSFESISLSVECLITHGRDQISSATGKWHTNTYLLEKDSHFVVHHPTDSHMTHLSFSVPTLSPSVTWCSLRTHKEAHTNPRKRSHSHTKGFHPSHLSKWRVIVVVYRNWETQKRLYHQESNPLPKPFTAIPGDNTKYGQWISSNINSRYMRISWMPCKSQEFHEPYELWSLRVSFNIYEEITVKASFMRS